MNLEDIMLHEIIQKKTWCMISLTKKSRSHKQVAVDRAGTGRVGEFWLPGAGRMGEMKRYQSKGIKLNLWKEHNDYLI